MRGAIFTSTVNGSRVNANIYAAKADVYLDGGPGMNAPSGAAALPPGDYYFQVTDPSGHHLLSTDDISCRKIHINDEGFIDVVYTGPSGCHHLTGIDQDYGALTVQLLPYLDTPNNGGEYKAWVTPVSAYSPTSGFAHNASKTDNFKIVANTPPPPPAAACGDGHLDAGEQCDDGNTAAGDGCSATCTIETPPPPPPPPAPCCGNGVVESGEACDDGNLAAGDGCSATCTIEPVAPVCGNGIVEDGEGCDDGNLVAGDGCSATCGIEPGTCDFVGETKITMQALE